MKSGTRYFVLTTLLVNAVLLFALGVPVHAKPMAVTFTVNDTTDLIDDNLTDGVCHTTTNTCALRAALMQANALGGANSINLPAGVYLLTRAESGGGNFPTFGDFDITSDMTLNGAGASNTIIDGNMLDRVFEIWAPARVTISNVTIRNGSPYQAGEGGGINNAGVLTITNSTVTSNTVINRGGGIRNYGTLYMSNVNLNNNTSGSEGAGLNNSGFAYLENVHIVSNNGYVGGGFDNQGTLVLENSTISENVASVGGGVGNSANLTILNSNILTNTADAAGGLFSTGFVTLTNALIANNQANQRGGGITSGGLMTITNVTISGNTAQEVAGIHNVGSMTLTNVTINGNQATNLNGIAAGIYNSYTVDSVVRLKNTIIASNGATPNCLSDMGLGIISLGHNISTDSSCNLSATGDKPTTNPLLGSLANNGGATQTHALLSGSPAINAGDNNGCPSTDQRGQSRVGTCDIGAYEYGLPTAVAVNSFAAYNDHTGLPRLFLLGIIVIGGVVIAGSVRARRRSAGD
ncbi:MAG: hypothetical protein HY868_22140 [Chloroflexi bacterium]|nr:hypothetical protein [Chloroflexota bacterium]